MKRIILLCLVILGCEQKPNLQSKLDGLFKVKPDGPGVAVLISKNDSVIYSKTTGLADLKTKEPITNKTLFNLGSISKTFVSNAILMLRDEGKLSLEDSLIIYFPEFKNKELAKKVRIKHLLTHTSGLPDNRPVSQQREFYLTANDAQNWEPVTQADYFVFLPGARYEYSNPAFNGLALIIEKVTGQKWQSFIEERIFKPAGMTTSTITDGPHPASGVSHGYVQENGEWSELDFGEEPTFCAAGNGGVWSSIDELVKYQNALEAATFSKSETIAESMEVKTFPAWSSKEDPFIGWSWFVGKTPEGLQYIGHTGTQGGFYCDYISIPSKKILYVMLANYPIDRDQLHVDVLKVLQEEGL